MSDKNKAKIVHAYLPKDKPFETTLTAGNHEFIADEPESVDGGRDKGPDPYDYLLMALASCTVMTVKMYASRKEWPLDDLFIELKHYKSHAGDCEDCEDKGSKIDVLEKELIVEGDLSEKQLDKLLDISKKCPVHRTLQSDIKIESTIACK